MTATSTVDTAAVPGGGSKCVGDGGGRWLHLFTYGILVAAFDALVTACVQQHDFALLEATLELSMRLFTSPGQCCRQ